MVSGYDFPLNQSIAGWFRHVLSARKMVKLLGASAVKCNMNGTQTPNPWWDRWRVGSPAIWG